MRVKNYSNKAKAMNTYKASGISLEFPDNLFEQLDRDTVEHVIKSYLEENDSYRRFSPEDQMACVDEFMDQIKPRGSCWSIV